MSDADRMLSDLERAFQRAGFDFQIRRKPESPYTGGIATVDLGEGRTRQVLVSIEGENCGLFWPKASGTSPDDGPSNATWFNAVALRRDGPEKVVQAIRNAIRKTQLNDPAATSADIRQLMEEIASPARNVSSMGNPRGSDIAALAGAILRLLDRIESLENN